MIPAILFGSFALLFSGCATTQTKKPEKPSPQQPTRNSASALPPEDPQAKEIYRRLKDEYGVKDEEINQGCHLIDYRKAGPNEEVIEVGGDIKACEVSEFVLDRYAQFPALAEAIAGKPIPWGLDDLNPATSFDEGVRTRVKAVVAQLEKILLQKGLRPDSEAFQEKMALGLFYFSYFPDDQTFIQSNRENLLNVTRELKEIGLGEVQEYLFKERGLGISLFPGDAPKEASALESLQIKRGWCTERSKILYAVFRLAKLKPFFVHVRGWEAEARLKEAGLSLNASQRAAGHYLIGLNFGSKTRYFDLSIFNSSAKFPNVYHERLTHFLSGDLNNRAVSLLEERNFAAAEKLLSQAKGHDPHFYGTFANLSSLFYEKEEYPKALEAAQRAVQLEPKFAAGFYNLFVIQSQMDQDQIALESIKKAIQLSPEESDFYIPLGEHLAGMGRGDEAVEAYQKGIRLNPKSTAAYLGLAQLFLKQEKLEAADQHLKAILKIDPTHAEANYLLGLSLHRQKRTQEALPYLRQGLAKNPNHALAQEARQILGR